MLLSVIMISNHSITTSLIFDNLFKIRVGVDQKFDGSIQVFANNDASMK